MALEIIHLDETRVEGLLDGDLPFTLEQRSERITARIAGWTRTRKGDLPRTEGAMRSAAYEMLARYRESERFGTA